LANVPETPAAPRAGLSRGRLLGLLAVGVIVLDLVALVLVPPFPKGGAPGEACAFPVCFINGQLEFPPPHTVIDLAPNDPMPTGSIVITFHPSISSTILTMWLVVGVLLVALILMTRGRAMVPGRLQNVVEFAYESLASFATSLGGAAAKPYIPLFAAFFIFILFSNWSGLVPPIGKVDFLRAPTSDVNVTMGLALVSFLFFEWQGFKVNGVRGYLSKFFPFASFREGVGAESRDVRRPRRAAARVHQAAHAVDAALRQHLRGRGRPRRHHGPQPGPRARAPARA
jgi:hypothetical protein